MTVAVSPPSSRTTDPADAERPRVRRAIIPAAARIIDLGRSLTAEQFAWFPSSEGKQELVDGRIIAMPPVGPGHGKKQLRFGRKLGDWNDEHKLGEVMVETGYVFDRNSDLTRGPDISFIRTERIPPDHDDEDFYEVVPDCVVEVRSKNDRLHEVRSKAEEYVGFGVPLVVVVDPKRRRIEVHRPGAKPVILNEGDTLDGGDVLPGFRVAVADLI